MHLSLPKRFPLFILASSVCWSLQCLISTLTQEGSGGHLFRLPCSVLQWGGGTLQTNIPGVSGECSQCLGCTGFAPAHGACAFMFYTSQALGCSSGELSEVGPGLCALPRSKPLRFSDTPQRCRLGWACILCPSQVWAAQVTRCLAGAVFPRLGVRLITSPVPASRFSGWAVRALSQACHVSLLGSWSLAATLPADVDHPESHEVLVSNGAYLQFGRGYLFGAEIAPFCLWLPPARPPPAGDGPVFSLLALLWYSLSTLFCEWAWRYLRLGLFAFSWDS